MQGLMPIPISAIERYGRRHYGNAAEFTEIMRRMDSVYMRREVGHNNKVFSREAMRRG